MNSDDLDKLEQRLRTVLATVLREQAALDPAWSQFRSTVVRRYQSDGGAQNGLSSSDEPEDGEAGS